MFQRILLPTDGSDREAWAIEEAIRLARTLHVGILTVNVLPEATLAGAYKGVGTVLQGVESQLVKNAEAAVDRVEQLANQQGVQVEKLIIRGSPAEKIAECSREGDLIVMPTKGFGTRGAPRLGSVTARVVEIAERPVLVYRAAS